MRELILSLIERPAVRYLIVGGSTNLGLLALYAGLTALGLHEVTASSIGYATGIAVTYILNKGWSFRDQSAHHTAFIKYIVAYGAGYVVQIAVLSGLAFQLGLPHIIAQLVAVLAAAVSIFVLLKSFVFRQ
jgi:putative flippase GtrA